jgi:hypothetical protein
VKLVRIRGRIESVGYGAPRLHDSPGASRQTNWLAAPAEGFFLIMRMYQPEERMYRGKYTVPPVSRTN